jgi:hypothetical protein
MQNVNIESPIQNFMARRPKSSLAGIVGVASGFYGGKKLANIDKKFGQLTTAINTQTKVQISGFSAILELQVANLVALREISIGLTRIEDGLSGIHDIMLRQEMREERVGDFKLIVLAIEEALDHIDSIKEEYLPWATFETRVLLDLIEEYDIKIEDFKLLPPLELKYVKNVLNRLNSTNTECMLLLGERN